MHMLKAFKPVLGFISEKANGAVYRYLHVYGSLNLQKGDFKTS